jgi:hypothetical protein
MQWNHLSLVSTYSNGVHHVEIFAVPNAYVYQCGGYLTVYQAWRPVARRDWHKPCPPPQSTKQQVIPVRITPAMRRQLDELIALGFGTQADVIRLAVDRMHQAETQAAKSAE